MVFVVESYVHLLIAIASLAVTIFAFVNSLLYSKEAYVAAGTTSLYEGHGLTPTVIRAYRENAERDALSLRMHAPVSMPSAAFEDKRLLDLFHHYAGVAGGRFAGGGPTCGIGPLGGLGGGLAGRGPLGGPAGGIPAGGPGGGGTSCRAAGSGRGGCSATGASGSSGVGGRGGSTGGGTSETCGTGPLGGPSTIGPPSRPSRTCGCGPLSGTGFAAGRWFSGGSSDPLRLAPSARPWRDSSGSTSEPDISAGRGWEPPRSPDSEGRPPVDGREGSVTGLLAAPGPRCACSKRSGSCSIRCQTANGCGSPARAASSARTSKCPGRCAGGAGRAGGAGAGTGGGPPGPESLSEPRNGGSARRRPPGSGPPRRFGDSNPAGPGADAGFCGAVTIPPDLQDSCGDRRSESRPQRNRRNAPRRRSPSTGHDDESEQHPLRRPANGRAWSCDLHRSRHRGPPCHFCYRRRTLAAAVHPYRCFSARSTFSTP